MYKITHDEKQANTLIYHIFDVSLHLKSNAYPQMAKIKVQNMNIKIELNESLIRCSELFH